MVGDLKLIVREAVTPILVGRFRRACGLTSTLSGSRDKELTFRASVSSKTIEMSPPWMIPSCPHNALPRWTIPGFSALPRPRHERTDRQLRTHPPVQTLSALSPASQVLSDSRQSTSYVSFADRISRTALYTVSARSDPPHESYWKDGRQQMRAGLTGLVPTLLPSHLGYQRQTLQLAFGVAHQRFPAGRGGFWWGRGEVGEEEEDDLRGEGRA